MNSARSIFGRFCGAPLLAMVFLGCSGKHGEEPQPVAECQEYEAAFARCTGVKAPIANQPAALASSDLERKQLKEVCETNLRQLRQACR